MKKQQIPIEKYNDKEKHEVAYITIQVEVHWRYRWKVEKKWPKFCCCFFSRIIPFIIVPKKKTTKITKTWPTPKTSSKLVDCTTPTPNPSRFAGSDSSTTSRRLAQALLIPSRLLRQWRWGFSFQTLQQQTQLDETRRGMEHTSENTKKQQMTPGAQVVGLPSKQDS